MTPATLAEILKLSVAERIQLAQDIWDSIADDLETTPVSDERRQELDRRLDELHANPDAGTAWSEVRGRLLAGE